GGRGGGGGGGGGERLGGRPPVVRAGAGEPRGARAAARGSGGVGGSAVRAGGTEGGRARAGLRGRQLVRRPPRPLLADREPQRGAAAAARDRRPPLVRPRVAPVPRLPR